MSQTVPSPSVRFTMQRQWCESLCQLHHAAEIRLSAKGIRFDKDLRCLLSSEATLACLRTELCDLGFQGAREPLKSLELTHE